MCIRDSIHSWARNLADITGELRDNDQALAELIDTGGPAAAETTALIDRVAPTVPIILANLVSLSQVAVTYHDGIEQLLVLIPQGVSMAQGGMVANHGHQHDLLVAPLFFDERMQSIEVIEQSS